MDDKDVESVSAWLVARGLAGDSEVALLHGFCERCLAAGLDLSRAMAIIDTLHPVYEGRVFRLGRRRDVDRPVVEYGPSNLGELPANWGGARSSICSHRHRRVPPSAGPRRADGFGIIDALREEGQTDYVAFVHRFAPPCIGEMDCVYSRPGRPPPAGFTEDELAALRRLMPPLALAIKCASPARIAGTLVEAYLGRDAGQRVLRADPARRRRPDQRRAVVLRSARLYPITDRAPPDEISRC